MTKFNFLRPLRARDIHEKNRAATELELLFDLVFVIAIAAAAHGLSHEISAGHTASGVFKFGLAFFVIWWPWNQFTWFASSFDNNDPAYRINVLVIMIGALFIAAGMSGFFKALYLVYVFIGYVIIRLAFAVLWIRVALANPKYRKMAVQFAVGQILIQIAWGLVVFCVTNGTALFYVIFVIGIIIELFLPWFAEKEGSPHWHRHHIMERFGLLNIIVLGEVLLGASKTFETAFESGFTAQYAMLAVVTAGIAFAMWWLYFSEVEHLESHDKKRTFIWGYGHFLVFASGAAVGSGLAVALENLSGHDFAHPISELVVSLSVSIPLGIYVFSLWLVRDRFALHSKHGLILLIFALAIVASGFIPNSIIPTPLAPGILLIFCLFSHSFSQISLSKN